RVIGDCDPRWSLTDGAVDMLGRVDGRSGARLPTLAVHREGQVRIIDFLLVDLTESQVLRLQRVLRVLHRHPAQVGDTHLTRFRTDREDDLLGHLDLLTLLRIDSDYLALLVRATFVVVTGKRR